VLEIGVVVATGWDGGWTWPIGRDAPGDRSRREVVVVKVLRDVSPELAAEMSARLRLRPNTPA